MKKNRLILILALTLVAIVVATTITLFSFKEPDPLTNSCEKVNPTDFSKLSPTTVKRFNKDHEESCSLGKEKFSETNGGWGNYLNGIIPLNALTPISSEYVLKDDAAQAFFKMNSAYKEETGRDLVINAAYRSLNKQKDNWEDDADISAYPGTSGHGWGTSLDLATAGTHYLQGLWLKENASKYGWINPQWARDEVAPEEPWHFDYLTESKPKFCKNQENSSLKCIVT